ncbi:MAG: hypothetical protein A2915_01670 [Candidatus Yanofskybacteria bacterium RIFCSPLOWO2_01_FULL_41_34]|uniref:Uncharacterized protein n=1 Tax=Candidatus Yanofskybacteria bacterium RIFCSPHIGHO2_01_FULL_41_26 TaxID=1802661 RepID=A0A1F8ECY9_9BACT|nr:MAG: hypothetical protein A2649_00610 [Candidatus Yanofskybacteria bacterium RIFCSPHIGHO2_01_FULL_41_26]OGN22944.1 MAG: hypothetical protein A2915_01670 [Candidatus Yanofskybacteria bacterium RIFCSPLOWO2_01_FULL_41_34]
MIRKIMSIFERFKKTPEEYSEEYFRKAQEEARKSVEKFERERSEKIEAIRNTKGFGEGVISTCAKLEISQEEAEKMTDDVSLYDYERKKFYIKANIDQIRKYVNSEHPKEIIYTNIRSDDLAQFGDYVIDVGNNVMIRYDGYAQYPGSRDMASFNFIPMEYKSESLGGYFSKTRFFLK